MIQTIIRTFIFVSLLSITAQNASSATIGTNETELKFSHYTSRIGLSQNHITSIFQDETGFMWIGTFNGLNRFDGYKFKNYYSQPQNPKTLSQNTINVIFQDSKKGLWIGTDKGLNKYDEKFETFTQYYHLNNDGSISAENNIRTIYEDNNGVFWIGFYGGGVRIFHPNTGLFEEIPELQTQINTLGLSKVNAFMADSRGIYWIGTELGGLISYSAISKRIIQYLPSETNKNSVSHRIISSLIEDKSGNIWIGTWGNGLDMYDRNTNIFTHYRNVKGNSNSLASNTITSLVLDKKGNLWMGTFDNGVTSFDIKNNKFSNFANNPSDINSISHNVVWRIYQDKSGVFWFGTFGGGLNKYNPDAANFESYKVDISKSNWLNNNQVNALLETSDGDLYLGTYGGGINKFNRKKHEFTYILNDSSSLGKIIRVLYEDSNKNIWVSTDQGVFKFDKDLKKKLFFRYTLNNNSIGEKSVYSILEDDNGDIWFGIWNGGIKILKKEEMVKDNSNLMLFKELKDEKFSNSTVWSLFKDTENTIWIGTNNSIYRYHKATDKFENFEKEIMEFDKELTISANCFFEDVDLEKIWFGTLNNGVGCYEKATRKITFLSKKNGLAHDEVFSILPDNKSNLWISTTYGLSQYNQRLKVFRNFDITNGGSHNELLSKAWLLKSKEIIIGGNKGFYIFNPEEIHDNVKPSPIVITDFKIFNKSIETYGDNSPLKHQVNFVDEININETDNVFSFEFSILDYRFSEKNEYQYMLEGFDKEWNISSIDNRVLSYTNLEGGTYILKIKGCNSDGIWNNEDKSVVINIKPKFYKTWWFKILFSILFFGFCWILIQQRFNKLKKQIKEKHHNQNIQKLIDERSTLSLLNNELEFDLDEKVKELAAVKLYIQNKDENLTKLRVELQEIIDQVKTTLKPQIITLIKNIDQELKQKKGWDAFKENIDVLQNDLIKRLAEEFPKLTQKDLIVCTYIRMAKTNKDIATLLNISLQSVEMARYRIRKKMDLDPKITLNDFLARY